MTEKHISFDIDDPRARKLAEVMSNDTAKKILNLLAEKDMSESDIAEALKIPLNTVGYNIKKLLDAGLIDKTKTFFWSSRGKKIPTYRVSNKKIIISPRRLASPIVLIIALVAAIALVALFAGQYGKQEPGQVLTDSEIKQFRSVDELSEFIKSGINVDSYYGMGRGSIMESSAGVPAAATSGAPSVSADKASSTGDYSETNVQVEGVDEPDIVKSDGKYIYTVTGNKVVIVDAYPAENMKVVSEIDLNSSAGNIFVNGDKLIILRGIYDYVPYYYAEDAAVSGAAESKAIAPDSGISIAPCYRGGCGSGRSETLIEVYDISDRAAPERESNFTITGNYIEARMIDDDIYLISSEYVYSAGTPMPLYSINGLERSVDLQDIYYFDSYDQSFVFTSISSLDLNSEEFSTKTYLTGASSVVYASKDNIYITSEKRMSYTDYERRLIEEAIIPLLSGDEKENAEEIMDSDREIYRKFNLVMAAVQEYSESLPEKDKEDFDSELRKSLQKFEAKIAKEQEKTVIYRIAVDNGDISYSGKGEVPGHVLNQFSLDEHEGNLRVAVTTGDTWNSGSLNHLYVLDEDMEVIGKVEDLAQGERIYSTRFMGNRAYMVTFRQVDPLYVIDLSDAQNPEVLGYLKVTGYSSYLHPYDENHIIGIGMEASSEGRASGLKMALFDVSNVQEPKENAKYTIDFKEQGWSSSDALYEHKAFLFDREKGILVIPVSISSYVAQSYDYWQGVYVFDINTGEIKLRGKIDHIEPYKPKYGPAVDEPIGAERLGTDGSTWKKTSIDLQGDGYWKNNATWYQGVVWSDTLIDQQPGGINYNYNYYESNYATQIQRSLYMDDVLYTASLKKVQANLLSDLRKIKSVALPYEELYYGYSTGGGVAIA